MKMIESKEEFEEFITSETPVIVQFSADWCGPCKMLSPILESVEDYEVVKVDVEKFPEIATEYGVSSVPTVVIIKESVPYETVVGVRPAAHFIDLCKSI